MPWRSSGALKQRLDDYPTYAEHDRNLPKCRLVSIARIRTLGPHAMKTALERGILTFEHQTAAERI